MGRKRKRITRTHPTHVVVTKWKRKGKGWIPVEGYYYKAGKRHKWSLKRDKKGKAKRTVHRLVDIWRGDLPGKKY